MMMSTVCAGFVRTTIRARPLDLAYLTKISLRPLGFYAYITEKSHTKMLCIFLTGSAYAPYATCMATQR